MIIFAVTTESRDNLGRIVEEVESVFLTPEAAITRRKIINNDPVKYPDMVADTREFVIRDFAFATPATGKRTSGRPRKLSPETVLEIRERYAAGESMRELGREFGVHPASISAAINRKSWAHV